MTEIDDLELSQRLRALRVDPPQSGFEARLAAQLRTVAPAPVAPARRGARVIVGPWLRRGPVRLIGATALFLAGAAAAVEGGVVEWVQARVQAVRSPEPSLPQPSPPPAPSLAERSNHPVRPARVEPPAVEPAISVPRVGEPAASEAASEPTPSVPRLLAERRFERTRTPAPAPERRPALDPPLVPRLEIDTRRHERRADPDTRVGRALAKPGDAALARERGRDLDRIRDIAKARREQAAKDDRPRPLERLRERRERINAERREIQERGRRERQTR